MAIIYSYPQIIEPQDSDLMLISDMGSIKKSTRSISLLNLADFINSKVNLSTIGDTGTGVVNLSTQSLSILGTSLEVETSAVDQTITIGLPDNVTITGNLTVNQELTVEGVSTFNDSATFNESVNFLNTILDVIGVPGVDGQVLSSTGTSVKWIDNTATGTVTGTGTTNKLPLWTDGPNSVLGDSMATQDPTAVSSVFEINAIKGTDEYTTPTGSTVYKIKSGNAHKFSITQDGGGGVILPSGDILENGPSINLGGGAFANGENALAVGGANTAFGKGSFAINFLTLASGGGSSAFGLLTEASGLASAVFGNKSIASGTYSIASGQDSVASGQSSVAIGEKGEANGKNSFVQGFGGTAAGNNAAKFGYAGSADGNNAVKFGYESIASGNNSFASGWQTTASGLYSFVTGDGNIASGERTAAFGVDNNVSGKGSFAIGARNVVPSENSFVGGADNALTGAAPGISGAQQSLAFGNNNSVAGNKSVVLGASNTIVDGAVSSTVIGDNNNVSEDQIVIIGRNINTSTDALIDSSTSAVIGASTSGSTGNIVIVDRQLRIGKGEGTFPSGTPTGFINFNDSVYANNAYYNNGGIIGYFPNVGNNTSTENFFTAVSENVNFPVFNPGLNPTSARFNIGFDVFSSGGDDQGGVSPSVTYTSNANTANGHVEYRLASQSYDYATGPQSLPGGNGVFTFDARYQSQNYSMPNGSVLFQLKSGAGQTKFEIKQAAGGGTANGAAALNFGKSNSSTGQGSVAMGQGLTASADNAFAAGIGNQVASIYAAAFGDSNNVTTGSFSSFVAGTNNSTNTKPKSIVLGQGLTSRDENAITLGRFNAVPTQNSIFVLGNGTGSADIDRKNAIEVTKADSHIVLPAYGSGTVSGTPVYNLSVDANGVIIETNTAAGTNYSSAVFLLNQSGASAPVNANLLENSLGIPTPFNWTRISSGEYNLNAPGKFSLLKTIVFINGGSAENNHDVAWEVIDTDNLAIRTHNSDGKLTKASVEIRTYN